MNRINNPKNIHIHTDLAQKLIKLGVYDDFLLNCNGCSYVEDNDSINCVKDGFVWSHTKQKHHYWKDIAIKCGE